MMYNELVEHCFFKPRHVGILDMTEPLSAYYRVGELGRGDVIDFYLICDAKGIVLNASFKAYGNPYLLAAAEWLCRQLKTFPINEHPCFDYADLVKELDIPRNHFPVALGIEEGYKELIQIMKTKLEGKCDE